MKNLGVGVYLILKAMGRGPVWPSATKTFVNRIYRYFHYQNSLSEQKKWTHSFLDSKNDFFQIHGVLLSLTPLF